MAWWDDPPPEDDPNKDGQDSPSGGVIDSVISAARHGVSALDERPPTKESDSYDYGDNQPTSTYDSLTFPEPDKHKVESSSTATATKPAAPDNMLTSVMNRARERMAQATSDPQLRSTMIDKVLTDWQQESGRRMPNVNDPTDMANFKKYSEDWLGVAQDESDNATGKRGIADFRKQVVSDVQKQQPGTSSNLQSTPSSPTAQPQTVSQAITSGGVPIDPTFKKVMDGYVTSGQLTQSAADQMILDHAVALGKVTKEQADALKRAGAPTEEQGNRDRWFDHTSAQMGQLVQQGQAAGLKSLDLATGALLSTQQGQGTLGSELDPAAIKNVASAISAGEAWADPALQAVARASWQGPGEPNPQYIQNWIGMYKQGADVPGAKELRQQIREQGSYAMGSPLGPGWKTQLANIDQGQLITDPAYRQSISAGLTESEAGAVCGPIAAIAFARANGRDPNLGEALALARQVGWTEGKGMAGISSQQALAEKLGVKSDIGVADPARMAQSVGENKPVIISTGAHYFVATDYDANSGKFFVGATGRALRVGKDWMSVGEMDAAAKSIDPRNGGVNGALYMQTPAQQAQATPASSQMPQSALGVIPVESLRPIIMESAQTNGLDPALIAAKIDQESSWQPRARSGMGAGGYTQLMPDTARSLGVTDVNDPRQNIMGGGKYLKQMIDRYGGDIALGLAAYNAGPGNVDNAIRQAGTQSFEAIKGYLPRETQGYVPLVLGKRQQYVQA